MVDSSKIAVKFIGVLNRLARDYALYGLMPKSDPESVNFSGLVYDDTKVNVSEDGWTIALLENGLNGESFNDIFPDAIFEVRWNAQNYIEVLVSVGGDTYHIGKDTWYL